MLTSIDFISRKNETWLLFFFCDQDLSVCHFILIDTSHDFDSSASDLLRYSYRFKGPPQYFILILYIFICSVDDCLRSVILFSKSFLFFDLDTIGYSTLINLCIFDYYVCNTQTTLWFFYCMC